MFGIEASPPPPVDKTLIYKIIYIYILYNNYIYISLGITGGPLAFVMMKFIHSPYLALQQLHW